MLAKLSTIVKNRVVAGQAGSTAAFDLITLPDTLHARAFELLGVSLTAA
jgi:ATP-dependent protease HslVU (ClpYQ) peptidase subunit